jgi:2,3-bisphosphoglycerate-independent phosphoglycerate mutase
MLPRAFYARGDIQEIFPAWPRYKIIVKMHKKVYLELHIGKLNLTPGIAAMTTMTLSPIIKPSDDKIVLLLFGGLGGLQSGPNMLTELQQAHRPHLNALARKSACGLLHPLAPGITPAPGIALRKMLGWQENMVPDWKDALGLNAVALSASLEYADIFSSAGITAMHCSESPAALVALACSELPLRDLVIIHFSTPEKFGLQGGYYEKVKALEEIDVVVQQLQSLAPEVIAACGDYSCPSSTACITWHPVPLMIQAKTARYDMVQTFDEIACAAGALGSLCAEDLLPLLLAHAGRLAPLN